VLGATSKIALEFARLAAAEHKELLLVARRPERLAELEADLVARGAARVDRIAADLADISGHAALVQEIAAKMPEFDTVLLAYGTLGEQERAEESAEYALAELNTNFTSAVSLLTRLSGVLENRGAGCIAAIASVASVTGGTVLMTIADTSQMHLLGVVDENEIARVQVGMNARIRTETYPDRTFPGRVRKIASIGDRKNNVTSFKVEVTVLDGIDALWPRMSADADIVSEVRAQALILPEATLLYKGNDIFVEVVGHASGPRLTQRLIHVGVSNHNRVEIVDGLAEGEVVKLQ